MKKFILGLFLLVISLSAFAQVRPVFPGTKLGGNSYWLSPARTDTLYLFMGASGHNWRMETSADTFTIPRLRIDTSQIENWSTVLGPLYWSDTVSVIATHYGLDTVYSKAILYYNDSANVLHWGDTTAWIGTRYGIDTTYSVLLTRINGKADTANVLYWTDTLGSIATISDVNAVNLLTDSTKYLQPKDLTKGFNSDTGYYDRGRLNMTFPRIGSNDNAFIGYGTGVSNSGYENFFGGTSTGAGNTGNYNVGLGYNAFALNAGTSSVAIGNSAGNSNSGSNSVLLGNTTGIYNTGDFVYAIGRQAADSNSGSSVIALGDSAAWHNTLSNRLFIGKGDSTQAFIYGNLENDRIVFNSSVSASSTINTQSDFNMLGLRFLSADYDSINIRMGWLAGDSGVNKGFDNIYIGNRAGRVGVRTYQNTFVGAEAGRDNTGSGGAYFGAGSGEANTTGSSNAFLGTYAGNKNTIGLANTYVGVSAGKNMTTGSYNSILGAAAGENAGTTSNNTFIGYQAGQTASGNDNVYIGYQAVVGIGNGTSNVVIGNNTMTTSTGDDNVILGMTGAAAKTAGDKNVMLGRYVNSIGNTGDENVYIGYAAGQTTNGSGNVFIGNGAGSVVSVSNRFIVGNKYNYPTTVIDTTQSLLFGKFHTTTLGQYLFVNGDLITRHASAFLPHDSIVIPAATDVMPTDFLDYKVCYVVGDTATIDTVTLANGFYDGQEVEFIGLSDSFTVTFASTGNMLVNAGTSFTLNENYIIGFRWSARQNRWLERYRSANGIGS